MYFRQSRSSGQCYCHKTSSDC